MNLLSRASIGIILLSSSFLATFALRATTLPGASANGLFVTIDPYNRNDTGHRHRLKVAPVHQQGHAVQIGGPVWNCLGS